MSARRLIVATALTTVLLAIALAEAERQAKDVYFGDFGRVYFSTSRWFQGEPMYVPVPAAWRAAWAAGRQQTDLNPPHFHLLLLPFLFFETPVAFWFWRVLSLAVLIWALGATLHALGLQVPRGYRLAAGLAIVASAPILVWVQTGQLSLLLMGPLTASWIAARRARWLVAGVLMGLCWSIKPFLGTFAIYWLLSRQWVALAAASAASAGAFVVGLAVFGVNQHLGWIDDLRHVTWAANPANGSLFGLWSRTDASIAWLAVSAGAIVVGAGWAISQDREAIDRHWLLVLLLSLLLSPLGWIYYALWIAGPALAVWHRDRSPVWVVAAAGLWIPLPLVQVAQVSPLMSVTLGSAYTWGLLALWGAAVRDAAIGSQHRFNVAVR